MRLSLHDKPAALDLLLQLYDDRLREALDSKSSKTESSARGEMHIQLALQLASTYPGLALGLAGLALERYEMPSDNSIGDLLFALKRRDKNLADSFFEVVLIAMRRSGLVYNPAILSLTIYVTDFGGHALPDASPSNVLLLAAYISDAAANLARVWQAAPAGEGIGEADANLFGFLMIRGAQVLALNAPDQLANASTSSQLVVGTKRGTTTTDGPATINISSRL